MVDRGRGDGRARRDGEGSLRADHWAGAFGPSRRLGHSRRLLHHQGPLRRRRRVVAGKSPVERGKRGIKRSRWPSMPMGHPAWLHYRPGTAPRPTATTRRSCARPWTPREGIGVSARTGENVHLDRGYDSDLTRKRLEEERSLIGVISEKGKPAPLQATKRWVAWSARTPPGITLTRRSWCGVPSGEESGHRLLGGLLEGDHHRGPAHPKSLDSLPLGEPPFSQTVTYWRDL